MLADFHVTLLDIMMVCIPSTLIACMIGAVIASKTGKELKDDPIYRKRLKEGLAPIKRAKGEYVAHKKRQDLGCHFFLIAALSVVLFGSFESLRPGWMVDGEFVRMGMPETIEIIMLTAAAVMILWCKANVEKIVSDSVFKAGASAVVAIFGIAWMGDTFFHGNAE